tara:strand:+ start:135 stop:239 length:105 start_codon:yes stop_codon:yes gene_type:complete
MGKVLALPLASPQGKRLTDGRPADCFIHLLLNDL